MAVAEQDLLRFLQVAGRSVEEALRARRSLLADLLRAREEPDAALDRAALASRRCVRAFDDALARVSRSPAPPAANECRSELCAWLEAHLDACDLLNRAAVARDADDFRRAIQCLTDGSLHALVFNRARERLVQRLAS